MAERRQPEPDPGRMVTGQRRIADRRRAWRRAGQRDEHLGQPVELLRQRGDVGAHAIVTRTRKIIGR